MRVTLSKIPITSSDSCSVNDNEQKCFRLLSFALALRPDVRVPETESAPSMRAGPLSPRFFVILFEPLLVALVHVIREAVGNAIGNVLFHGGGRTDIC